MVNNTNVAGWLASAPKIHIVGSYMKIVSKSVILFSAGLRIKELHQSALKNVNKLMQDL